MGVKNLTSKKEAEAGKAQSAAPKQQKPVSRKSSGHQGGDEAYPAEVNGKQTMVTSGDVERGKLLEKFLPENIAYLKDTLGVDLADAKKYDNEFVSDILYGRVTKPVEMTVTPLAYDYASKTRKEMPQVAILSSVRMMFPHDSKFNQVAIDPADKDRRLFVVTYPHYLKCEKVAEGEIEAVAETRAVDKGSEKDKIDFSAVERQALEGIGINSQRLYGGKFNSIDYETKEQMRAGEDFVFAGTLNTEVGALNVSGIGRLSSEDGKVSASFESIDEQEGKDLVLDITTVRKIGSLELDFYDRDDQGKILRDENGQPQLNAAGWNLVEYGQAMEPVAGYVHSSEWNKDLGRYEEKATRKMYQVSVINGGLVTTEMKQGEDKRWLVSTRMKDGKVYVGGQLLEFASEKDRDMYVHGQGGVVKNVPWKDYKTGKTSTYEAFVVADNKKNGYGVAYSPSASRKLIERRSEFLRQEEVKEAAAKKKSALLKPRKQGFSIKH